MFFLILFIIMVCLNGIILAISAKLLYMNNKSKQKINQYYQIMAEWIKKHQNKEMEQCLYCYQNKRVAIYGMREMGKLILNELLANHINVQYVVDRDESVTVGEGIRKYLPDSVLPDVDVMIVTASFYFDEIKEMLENKGMKCDIVSIDDVIYRLI